MNLTGNWKGKYTYGNGYPLSMFGTSDPFTLSLQDEGGKISGTCTDKIVEGKAGNESIIEGSFHDNFLRFVKTYKYHGYVDQGGNNYYSDTEAPFEIDYVGHLRKRFLTGKIFFAGEWQITTTVKDENGKVFVHTFEGTWSMTRI